MGMASGHGTFVSFDLDGTFIKHDMMAGSKSKSNGTRGPLMTLSASGLHEPTQPSLDGDGGVSRSSSFSRGNGEGLLGVQPRLWGNLGEDYVA
jgi:hypothetical protein